jgi:hypothetical protein
MLFRKEISAVIDGSSVLASSFASFEKVVLSQQNTVDCLKHFCAFEFLCTHTAQTRRGGSSCYGGLGFLFILSSPFVHLLLCIKLSCV